MVQGNRCHERSRGAAEKTRRKPRASPTPPRETAALRIDSHPHQPRPHPLSARRHHQAGRRRLLRRRRRADAPRAARPAARARALERGHRQAVVVSPGRRPRRAAVGDHDRDADAHDRAQERAAPRRRQARDAALAGADVGADDPHVGLARRQRSTSPTGSSSISIRRKGRGSSRPSTPPSSSAAFSTTSTCRRAEDLRQARHPRLRPARRRLHARGGQRVRLLDRRRGGGEGPRVHDGARAEQTARTALPRLHAERVRQDDRRAVLAARHRRRAGLRAAEVGRGDEEARSEKVQPAHDARTAWRKSATSSRACSRSGSSCRS